MDVSRGLGKTIEEVVEIVNQALLDLSENRLPWQFKDGPFTTAQVRSRVDYLQKQIIGHKKPPPEKNASNILASSMYQFYTHGYLKKTDELLIKNETLTSRRIHKNIQAMVNKIVEEWETSADPAIIQKRNVANAMVMLEEIY